MEVTKYWKITLGQSLMEEPNCYLIMPLMIEKINWNRNKFFESTVLFGGTWQNQSMWFIKTHWLMITYFQNQKIQAAILSYPFVCD